MRLTPGVVLEGSEGLGQATGSLALGCKVNWSLEVLGRRADGFHELRSWFLGLDGGDLLSWSPGPSRIQVDGPDSAGVPSGPSNLVLQADQTWRAAGGEAPILVWRLGKFLPAGSGLGAGSADAAGVLHVLQACATRPLTHERCRDLALSLGSDVPFFYEGQAAVLLGGRGEQHLQVAEPPQAWIVLAIPPFSAATPDVFAALQAPAFQAAKVPTESSAGSFPERPQGNALAEAALRCVPGLVEVSERLDSIAAFQLSGSGSAWFTVVPDGATQGGRELARSQAEALAARVRGCGCRASVHRPWPSRAEAMQ
jgi:4-diphosphocytidyl-2-C-methyl-D-erythritol kinase